MAPCLGGNRNRNEQAAWHAHWPIDRLSLSGNVCQATFGNAHPVKLPQDNGELGFRSMLTIVQRSRHRPLSTPSGAPLKCTSQPLSLLEQDRRKPRSLVQILINSERSKCTRTANSASKGHGKQYMEGQSCFGRPCQFSNTSDAAALQGSCFACSRVLDQFSQVATYNHRCACTPPLIWKLPVFRLPGMHSAFLFGACR